MKLFWPYPLNDSDRRYAVNLLRLAHHEDLGPPILDELHIGRRRLDVIDRGLLTADQSSRERAERCLNKLVNRIGRLWALNRSARKAPLN